MTMNKTVITPFFFALACLFSTPKATFAEPANLYFSKQNVIKYYNTGAYQRELLKTTQQASRYISQRSEKNTHLNHPEKLALILDIDETSLSNFAYMKQNDFSYDEKKFHQYMLQGSANAIIPTLELYKHAEKKNISIFFITGRKISEARSTICNLHQAGYQHWQQVFFKPLIYHANTLAIFKATIRKKIQDQGYTIIASIGDQISDCTGGYTEKCFKLPNPWYFIS